MSRLVLFIESVSSPLREECAGELDFVSEHIQWSSLDLERLRDHRADLVVAVAAPRCSSAENFLRWLVKNPIGPPTLAVLPPDNDLIQLAAEAVDDFIVEPIHSGEWHHRVARLLANDSPDNNMATTQERETREFGLAELVGNHPAFLRTIEQIPLVARNDSPVLITGETGTGKELCARAIHRLSARSDLPFIPVDCSAFPEHLFETEMFGHARGAFTDAHRDQMGLVALAGSGTLFLDEVDALPIAFQSKLLRLLQEHTYRPIGSERFVKAEVKIISACNQNLNDLLRERRFRLDLFFRLNVLQLHLVPLRERRSDISILARYFVSRLSAESGTPPKALAPAVVQKLREYDWPGNVRELYNVIQRAFIFSQGKQIQLSDVCDLPVFNASSKPSSDNFRDARARALEAFERAYIEEKLRETGGNITRASRLAGKDRRAFGRLMKRHNIRTNP
ncbi:sigma-54-dependent Fis family transcriptional regulator [Bradyrhizobium hipponense]|uniref:Sigma-54-dependent Fis family transcriptional regulator n=1 Tax=Bradyrhizobium hipponense TaxID=2605638 RepID=A0A5S4YWT0_9BRAD|nr:sigma-54 dependent transcriptional regulator [Bradyrhizobium hipponense]TYO65269.1 sigma-54-dependent Fis family transcriptional regulator [Bradyrhizobium hipponense]